MTKPVGSEKVDIVKMTEKQYLFAQDLTRLRIAEQILREIVSVDVKYITSLVSELSCAFYRDLELEDEV